MEVERRCLVAKRNQGERDRALIGLTIKKNKKQFNAITLLDFKGAVNGRIRFFESARSNNKNSEENQ